MKSRKPVIIVSILILFAVLYNMGAGTTNPPGKTYLAQFRPEIGLPKLDEENGRKVFMEKMNVIKDSDLKLKVKVPNFANKETMEDFDIELLNGNLSNKIEVRPNESWNKSAKLSNGNDLNWGAVTGNFDNSALGSSLVTIGFVEVPQEEKVNFNVVIEANNNHPPIFISFGNLERNPEIINIIIPKGLGGAENAN